MSNQQFKLKRDHGFSLIELLVGLALSVVVLGGVLALYVPTLQTYKIAASQATVQDIEQLTQDVLGQKIRQASLLVCGQNTNIVPGVTNSTISSNLAPWIFNFEFPFRAYSATDTTSINNMFVDINSNRLNQNGATNTDNTANSTVGDVFYTLAPDGAFARMTSIDNSNLTRTISIQNAPTFEEGELFLIHDCSLPAVFRATTGSNSNTLNFISTAVADNQFGTDAGRQPVISRFQPSTYYLGALTIPKSNQAKPALYQRSIRRALNGSQLISIDAPIITGVVNMRIEYGIDAVNPASPSIVTNYYTMARLSQQSVAIQDSAPLTARLSLMIEADQNSGNNPQTTLLFPDLLGNEVDCVAIGTSATASQKTACPDFVANRIRNTLHKVVKFTFTLNHQRVI